MRKLFISLVALFVGIAGLFAQNPMEQFPLDPEVRIGVLDNGMSYLSVTTRSLRVRQVSTSTTM